jgi:hypothetical protein
MCGPSSQVQGKVENTNEQSYNNFKEWRRAKVAYIIRMAALTLRAAASDFSDLKIFIQIYCLLKEYPEQIRAAVSRGRVDESDANAQQLGAVLERTTFFSFMNNFLLIDWRMSKHAEFRQAFWTRQMLMLFLQLFTRHMDGLRQEMRDLAERLQGSLPGLEDSGEQMLSISQRPSNNPSPMPGEDVHPGMMIQSEKMALLGYKSPPPCPSPPGPSEVDMKTHSDHFHAEIPMFVSPGVCAAASPYPEIQENRMLRRAKRFDDENVSRLSIQSPRSSDSSLKSPLAEHLDDAEVSSSAPLHSVAVKKPQIANASFLGSEAGSLHSRPSTLTEEEEGDDEPTPKARTFAERAREVGFECPIDLDDASSIGSLSREVETQEVVQGAMRAFAEGSRPPHVLRHASKVQVRRTCGHGNAESSS